MFVQVKQKGYFCTIKRYSIVIYSFFYHQSIQIMLVNLDNEVHFKRVFTDVEVFCAFVKDVLGIDMNITKVETERVLLNRVSAIKFRMDLFAEDPEQRAVVEIQKIDYDYTYDRFMHYFLGNLIDMQRDSKTYKFAKDVYIIVVVTSAYRISDKTGKPIKDDVLVTDINARTLSGEVRDMYNHKMVILNTTYVTPDTPSAIRDWLDLISESMNHPYDPKINKNKPAIAKAAQLAEIDNVSPEELADAKIQELRKETVAFVEDTARAEGIVEGKAEGKAEGEKAATDTGILNALESTYLDKEKIAQIFKVTVGYVEAIDQKRQL